MLPASAMAARTMTDDDDAAARPSPSAPPGLESCTSAEIRLLVEGAIVRRCVQDFASFRLTEEDLLPLARHVAARINLQLSLDLQSDIPATGDDGDGEAKALLHEKKLQSEAAFLGYHLDHLVKLLRRLEDERERQDEQDVLRAQNVARAIKSLSESEASSSSPPSLPMDLIQNMLALGFEEHLKLVRQVAFKNDKDLFGVTVTYKDLVVNQDTLITMKRRRSPTTAFSAAVDVLFWPFLHVRASFQSTRHTGVSIPRLKGVSGVLAPGTMTLVLGPPGAGKTTLLHAIAGRMTSVGARHVSGSVKYNGLDVSRVYPPNFCTMVEQTDIHIASLTVRETIEFAYACRGPDMDHGSSPDARRLASARVDLVLAVLGLLRAADTPMGNNVIKGVSGGEMRRTTLAEMLAIGSKVLALDEISTGLDSAAAADITKAIRSICRVFSVTACVALLQPPPEVFGLFDEVILLSKGQIAYHGPRQQIETYFGSLGFARPVGRDAIDLADFLIEACKSAENRLANVFWESSTGMETLAVLARSPETFRTNHPEEASLLSASKYRRSFFRLLWILARRQWKIVVRNFAFINARIAQNLVMGLILGAVFFKIPFSQWYLVAMVLFNLTTFMGFSSMALLNDVIAVRNVFYKQSRENFFPELAYVLADCIVGFPFSCLDAFVLCTVVYFMAGLSITDNGTPYAIFIAICLSFGICMATAVRFFAYVSRDTNVAHGAVILFIVVEFIFSGATITPSAIPPYWIWIYWGFSPLSWAYRSAMQNEFYSAKYMASCNDTQSCPNNLLGECVWSCGAPPAVCPKPYPSVPCGTLFLQTRQVNTDPAFLWAGVGVVWAFMAVFVLMSWLALRYIRYDEDTYQSDLPPSSASAVRNPAGKANDNNNNNNVSTLDTAEASNADAEMLAAPASLVAEVPKALVWSNVNYTIFVASKDSSGRPSGELYGNTSRARHVQRIRKQASVQPLALLKRVSGFAKPYEMTALMGSSGAGKTTLLDVLSFRKTAGKVTGEFYLGAEPFSFDMASKLGYVEQFGQHLPQYTVRESMEFSARLRLPLSEDDAKIAQIVQQVLRVLELSAIADDLAEGLSFEEIKRLTMAVELVGQPRVLFADEPTSGLTSHEALVTMKAIRRVASHGVPVICTVHQPSAQVFALFDRLMLLKTGGRVVFFGRLGHGAQNMIDYFCALPGVAPPSDNLNPAAWMLGVIGGGLHKDAAASNGKAQVDYADAYDFSNLARENLAEARQLSVVDLEQKQSASFEDVDAHGKHHVRKAIVYSIPFWAQFRILIVRNLIAAWRTPSYSLVRWSILAFFAVIIGTMLYNGSITEVADVQSRVGAITMLLVLGGNFNAGTVIPYEFQKRAVFARERVSRMYSPWAYSLAEQLGEDPFVLVEVFLMVVIYYPLIQLSADANLIFYFFFLVFFYVSFVTNMSLFFISALPSVGSAQLAQTLVNQIFIMFSGVTIPGSQMPSWLLFIYYISPSRWANEGLLASQFAVDTTVVCYPTGNYVLTWRNPASASPNITLDGLKALKCPGGNATAQLPPVYLDDVGYWATCCNPTTSLPISARAMVFTGQTYKFNHAHIPGYLGGDNGYRLDWLVWDYLFVIGAMILFRLAALWALGTIQHIKR